MNCYLFVLSEEIDVGMRETPQRLDGGILSDGKLYSTFGALSY